MSLGRFKGGRIFTQDWVDGLKGMMGLIQNCKIEINRPTGENNYDPVTNTYNPVVVELYSGIARLQFVQNELFKDIPGDVTSTHNVQFQIPVDEGKLLELHPDQDVVKVTECELNPSIKTLRYVVSSLSDDANPFEYTFRTTVDQEVRV